MGVPKFFRWISERYPCLSTLVRTNEMPEFDNLYLDMNGIIHVCSHPEDENVNFRLDESVMFEHIVHYIEFLLQMIRPQKIFFMAIDGVAPRAKMNQQRSRRFRSAKVMADQEKDALQKGVSLPDSDRFDSNCITPGTEFMVRLDHYLQYFIVKKISEDPSWSKIKVIYSGHQTPGEGEHKILDFIRYQRTLKDYDPNTRHCLYGLDADLIMLGLSCHEPFCTLLREEVLFGRKGKAVSKRAFVPEELSFYLLHLSLLRDYIDLEFDCLKKQGVLAFPYDLEKIIDDWILLAFLVGNDFVPHLPNFHIHGDALPLLWTCYREIIVTLKGYLHDFGDLNITRFLKFLELIAQKDRSQFDKSQAGDLWMAGENARALGDELDNLGLPTAERTRAKEDGFRELESFFGEQDQPIEGSLQADSGNNETSSSTSMSQLEQACLDDEYTQHRRYYYTSKIGISMTPEAMQQQAKEYLSVIQWILFYYYHGTPCWRYFYPQHYAPFVVDVLTLKSDQSDEVDDETDDGRYHLQADWLKHVRESHGSIWKCGCSKPFLPFQQLMAVLPVASSKLLPETYRSLMLSDQLKDLYPDDFKTDLNGKKQEWEAVVLIPFIEEERLLNALAPLQASLSDAEKTRNAHGPHLVYQFTPKVQPAFHCSQDQVGFADNLVIENNHALCIQLPMDTFWLSSKDIRRTILPKCEYRSALHLGFGTLAGRNLRRTEVTHVGVKVFEHHTRKESMLLELQPYAVDSYSQEGLRSMVGRILHKLVYVEWPHLREAFIERVSSLTCEFIMTPERSIKIRMLDNFERSQLEKEYTDACRAVLQRRAICFSSSSEPLGEEKEHMKVEKNFTTSPSSSIAWIFVYGRVMVGCQYQLKHSKNNGEATLHLEKQWSTEEERFLWPQCYLPNINQISASDSVDGAAMVKKVVTSRQSSQMKLCEYLTPGMLITCIECNSPGSGYGTTGSVVKVVDGSPRAGDVKVILTDYSDRINVNHLSDLYHIEESSYVNSNNLLQRLQAALIQNDLSEISNQLSAPLLARLTGNLFIRLGDQRHNVGLNLKFNRTNECVHGFTRCIRNTINTQNSSRGNEGSSKMSGFTNTWLYCYSRVIPLLVDYIKFCPRIIKLLAENTSAESFEAVELFENKEKCRDRLKELQSFLAELPCTKAPRVGIYDSFISKDLLAQLSTIVDTHMAHMRFTKAHRTLHFNDVLKYEPLFSGVNPNEGRLTLLLDRVVNIRTGIQIPFGLRGSVVGVIVGSATKFREWFYEILFDLPFPGGIEIRGIKGRGYRLPESAFLNISAKERELQMNFHPLRGNFIPCPFMKSSENVSMTAKTDVTEPSQSRREIAAATSPPPSQSATSTKTKTAITPSEKQTSNTPEDEALALLKQINIDPLLQPSTETTATHETTEPHHISPQPQQLQQEIDQSNFNPELIYSFLELCRLLGLTSPPEVKEIYLPQNDGTCLIECQMEIPHNSLTCRPLRVAGFPKSTLEEAFHSVVSQAGILIHHPMNQVATGPNSYEPSAAPGNSYRMKNVGGGGGGGGHSSGGYRFSYIPPTIRDDPFRDTFYDPNREKMFQTRERYHCDSSSIRHKNKGAIPLNMGYDFAREQTTSAKPATIFVPSQAMAPRNATSIHSNPTLPQPPVVFPSNPSFYPPPTAPYNSGPATSSRGKKPNRRVVADFSSKE